MEASITGQLALIGFTPLCILLFAKLRRDLAAAISLIGAALFLPQRIVFDPPLIPPLDKHSIAVLVTFTALAFTPGQKVKGSLFLKLITALAIFGAIATVLTNGDSLALGGGVVIAGLKPTDAISGIWFYLVSLIIPFSIGRRVFRTKESVATLLKVIAHFGVVYAFLMLIEIRLSPQLNNWVYGFHQHSFAQSMRNGGFRPVVFMYHGLTTTLFCLMALFATLCHKKTGKNVFGANSGLWAFFLFAVLMLSNSMGVLVFCLIGAPLLWKGSPQQVARFSGLLALVALVFPLLRTSGLLPMQDLVDYVASHDAGRAQSLGFRVNMEEQIIEVWRLRPTFGYAGYGRSNIYDAAGNSTIIVDSQWMIALSNRGIVGYVVEFLLYSVPILRARKFITAVVDKDSRTLLVGLVLMVSISLFDLLLNSRDHGILPLLAGSLFGFCSTLKGHAKNLKIRA